MAKADLSTGCFHIFWYVFLIIIVVYAAIETGTFVHPLGILLVFGIVAGLVIFLSWIGSMGLGALNEVVEFLAFVVLAQTGVGDVYNTGFDLVFNLFGALAGSFIAYSLRKR